MKLQLIQNKIYEIRRQRVMLDYDLVEIYGVQTKALNQAVKRNIGRFPFDFMFQLSKTEFDNLRSQIVTSSWGGARYLPFAFTDYNDINEDTRMQIELINKTLAQLQADKKIAEKPRRRIGFNIEDSL